MENQNPPLLTVEQLTLSINGEVKISDLNFTLHAGERLCLLGASGSGKSLTAAAILGTLPNGAELSGSIRLLGQEISGQRLQQRKSLSLAAIFQDPFTSLNPLTTVGKQLIMALRGRSGMSKEHAQRCATELLTALGLPPEIIMMRYPGQLSGGQCQRVCAALALSGEKSLLIADEPTTALDMVSQHQLIDILKRYTERPAAPALLFITHDLAVAASLCQRAIVLANGTIAEHGSVAQLLRQPVHPYTQRLVATALRPTFGHAPSMSMAG
ncbi:Nickel-transporting ATPase [Serratia sp. AS12]|uniref:ATP-binding cassette domain-containing protein n=1 Tax=Serratia TaxID=613 RepID=UPI00020E99D2|nr:MULTISPECIES: ABC transporter ATP-binding protein [Serratia]AEF45893.1 Nickel-transporting ATPase [Serratia plymuthica AS9]AEF50844.1 Nickel-transporting ATPase [Serratia sp. AS12]AEG28551.1 Nickel-transporting ATPase [Serratia sp. AS13]